MEIRLARPSDYDAIAHLDEIAQVEPERRAFIKRAIEQRDAAGPRMRATTGYSRTCRVASQTPVMALQ